MSPIPTTMNAIEGSAATRHRVLSLIHRPVPDPGPGEVLIKVAAAGLNRADILQRKGFYPPPAGTSDILGLEVAGIVVGRAPDVGNLALGTEICALLAGGGYAEYAAVPAAQCLPVPAGLSLLEAAALPEAICTVWSNVVDRGRLMPDEFLLVHGGSSGIGSAAIQIGRAFGARVLATAGSAEKTSFCEALGALHAINYKEEDFVERVKDFTGGHGADVILDMVGGDYVPRNFAAAAPDARIVTVACVRGTKVEIDMLVLMQKRLSLTGSTLRARPVAEKAAIIDAVKREIWPLIESGQIRPVIDRIFPLAQAEEAHRLMESSTHKGKILLDLQQDHSV